MGKQLNIELFGELRGNDFESSSSHFPLAEAPQLPLDIDEQVRENQQLSHRLSEELEKIKTDQEEGSEVQRQKIERLQSSLARLELSHNSFVQDVSEKFQILVRKQNDQVKFEEKIQDLIDRHQNLINGYELRMQQLQKILGQKEVEIIELKSWLTDMKNERARQGR